MKKLFILATAFAAASHALCAATLVDLQDLSLPANSFYNGSSAPSGNSNFTSHGAIFGNAYSTDFGGYWKSGFAYSNVTDNTTAGFMNQYSAYTGGGSSAIGGATVPGGNYAVGQSGALLTLPAGQTAPLSLRVTNTTFAGISMRDGDGFAKKFGTVTPRSSADDFFLLTIEGLGADDNLLGKVDFYLADYRFALGAQDYIVSDWRLVDLTGLGAEVVKLRFSLTSSDNGDFGMNTPAYFAIDNLSVVPEPACGGLLALAAAGLLGVRRRKGSR